MRSLQHWISQKPTLAAHPGAGIMLGLLALASLHSLASASAPGHCENFEVGSWVAFYTGGFREVDRIVAPAHIAATVHYPDHCAYLIDKIAGITWDHPIVVAERDMIPVQAEGLAFKQGDLVLRHGTTQPVVVVFVSAEIGQVFWTYQDGGRAHATKPELLEKFQN